MAPRENQTPGPAHDLSSWQAQWVGSPKRVAPSGVIASTLPPANAVFLQNRYSCGSIADQPSMI